MWIINYDDDDDDDDDELWYFNAKVRYYCPLDTLDMVQEISVGCI